MSLLFRGDQRAAAGHAVERPPEEKFAMFRPAHELSVEDRLHAVEEDALHERLMGTAEEAEPPRADDARVERISEDLLDLREPQRIAALVSQARGDTLCGQI